MSENVKNILLVMSSQEILVPPSESTDKRQEALWTETWKRLERFLPHLFVEIFPEEAKKPRSSLSGSKRSSESHSTQRTGTPSNPAAVAVPSPPPPSTQEMPVRTSGAGAGEERSESKA